MEKALTLDPDQSEAHTTVALIRELYEWDWAGAEAAFKRAIASDPGNSEARREYGVFLSRIGRHEEAVAEQKYAQALDPLLLFGYTSLAYTYISMHDYDRAIAVLQEAIVMDANNSEVLYSLSWAYVRNGMIAQAMATCDRLMTLYEEYFYCPAFGYALSGKRAEAEKFVDEMIARWTQDESGELAWNVAWVFTAMGKHEQALDWLERLYDKRSVWIVNLRIHALGPLRAEPRFQALLEKMALHRPSSAQTGALG